jgi:hypothetical protein
MRIAYSGLIFRKVSYLNMNKKNNFQLCLKILRLSSQAMNNFSSGQITNLMANDANKIELAHQFFNHLWV